MRKSGLPIGSKHKSRGFQQNSSAGEDAKYVDCLLQAGLLVRHRMGAVEVMRLTAPGAGSVVCCISTSMVLVNTWFHSLSLILVLQEAHFSLCTKPVFPAAFQPTENTEGMTPVKAVSRTI